MKKNRDNSKFVWNAGDLVIEPRRGRGRVKGSKNKPKGDVEAMKQNIAKRRDAPIPEPSPPKRGRPFGSKNKPKAEVAALRETVTAKRGRPFGSKNKPKAEVEAMREQVAAKRGRPFGSKNKEKSPLQAPVNTARFQIAARRDRFNRLHLVFPEGFGMD